MASLVLLVGSSSNVVLSLEKEGEDYTELTTLSYALFMTGMSFISLFTIQIFKKGRKLGFLVGNTLGLIGAVMGIISMKYRFFPLMLLSYIPLGCAVGVGNYLRFAAVEVVPADFKETAVTLVLSGGVISAFLGPEAANATRDLYASVPFANVFIVVGIFNVAMMILISFVQFPNDTKSKNAIKESKTSSHDQSNRTTFGSILINYKFFVPVILASLSWGIMAMPMIIARVAMSDAGYTARSSLTVIELHFLGMFSPGFVSGKIIKQKGEIFALKIAVALFILAHIFDFVCQRKDDGGTVATWILGLFVIGNGWNFGFASATMWLTKACERSPHLKAPIQACNDFIMFAVTGISGLSTGYIYDAQHSRDLNDILRGWKSVNYVSLGGIGIFILVIFFGHWSHRKEMNATNKMDTTETVENNTISAV